MISRGGCGLQGGQLSPDLPSLLLHLCGTAGTRCPLWHEQLGFDQGRPRRIRSTLGQPWVGCPLPLPWRSGQSDAPGWAEPEVLQSFSFSSHPQYQVQRPPSTLPMFVIPALASHAAAPWQSLPVQGAWGGGPQLPPAPPSGWKSETCAMLGGAKSTPAPHVHPALAGLGRPRLPMAARSGSCLCGASSQPPHSPCSSPLSAFPPPC